jgi:AcrR family transcriptional regulator
MSDSPTATASNRPRLRDQQAALTRELILRSVAALLESEDPSEITVPAVAHAAGVSLRTVYRHFPTREELLGAAAEWVPEHHFRGTAFAERVDDLPRLWRESAESFDEHPKLVRAMALSRAGNSLRSLRRRQRLETLNSALEEVTCNLPPAERRRAQAVLAYLHNMLAWVSMREESGLDGHEIGLAGAWAMQTLIDDLRRRNQAAAKPTREKP